MILCWLLGQGCSTLHGAQQISMKQWLVLENNRRSICSKTTSATKNVAWNSRGTVTKVSAVRSKRLAAWILSRNVRRQSSSYPHMNRPKTLYITSQILRDLLQISALLINLIMGNFRGRISLTQNKRESDNPVIPELRSKEPWAFICSSQSSYGFYYAHYLQCRRINITANSRIFLRQSNNLYRINQTSRQRY
jgi:hypothetical protein